MATTHYDNYVQSHFYYHYYKFARYNKQQQVVILRRVFNSGEWGRSIY